MLEGTFRSLRGFNYRLWAAGAFVSNIGTWMQRTAQDWIVLAELTDNNATAVGVVMALQFGPSLVLLPLTGFAADHLDRRRLLLFTQSAQGILAFALGLLTVAGVVQLWHVYVFALLLGCVTAFDAPARQTFVAELVSDALLSNAVALNSMSFNGARMIGPALAGLLIAGIGTGWVFLINAASFVAVLVALSFLRVHELHRKERAARKVGSVLEGFGYVRRRPELMAVLAMLFVIMTFGINFPVFVSAMAVNAFHAGSGEFGALTSMLAVGSVTGAVFAAGRAQPRAMLLLAAAIAFGASLALAALMPSYILFGLVLIGVGWSAQTFNTTANSTVQLWTEPAMRGRVMAIYMAIAMGCTPLGAPLVGWVADRFGPRWSLAVGACSGFVAALVGVAYLVRHRGLRARRDGWRLRLELAGRDEEDAAARREVRALDADARAK
ncbi:MAG TPA: MFS transporter [Usitatibacter sp.]|nr:MFS transporter [Usitatibacter sp.]